jgi:hypothetical protein
MTNKEYHAQYYQKNKKKLLKKARIYNSTHKEERKEWHKVWVKKNPDKVLENKRLWRAKHIDYFKHFKSVADMAKILGITRQGVVKQILKGRLIAKLIGDNYIIRHYEEKNIRR